jgi:hypothetical protein
MSESDLQILIAAVDRLDRECDTPEKATRQLQSEGLLDANGKLPAEYGGEGAETAWQ